jgi:hypothetical protein
MARTGWKGYIAGHPSASVTSANASTIQALGDVTATAAEINAAADANTATAAEINNICDGSKSYVKVPDGAAYDVLAANTGKVHLLPDQTASCTMDLPAEADGLKYTFVYVGLAEDGQNYIIDAENATNYFIGGVEHQDLDNNTSATVYPTADTDDILTITTPGAGTMIHILCDGTNWIIWGTVCSATAPAFSATA